MNNLGRTRRGWMRSSRIGGLGPGGNTAQEGLAQEATGQEGFPQEVTQYRRT